MNKKEGTSEQFLKSLNLLKKLKENHGVFISLTPPMQLSFEIDREVLPRYLQEFELTQGDFQEEYVHISYLLLAVLANREENFIEFDIEHSELEGEEADIRKATLREQLRTVKETLLDTRLKQRYDLKASSKAPTFTSIDWDIKLKVKDAELEKIKFPYATCRIKYQREYTDLTSFLGGKGFDSVQLNFSLDEIEYLIKVLETIKQNLQEIEEGIK